MNLVGLGEHRLAANGGGQNIPEQVESAVHSSSRVSASHRAKRFVSFAFSFSGTFSFASDRCLSSCERKIKGEREENHPWKEGTCPDFSRNGETRNERTFKKRKQKERRKSKLVGKSFSKKYFKRERESIRLAIICPIWKDRFSRLEPDRFSQCRFENPQQNEASTHDGSIEEGKKQSRDMKERYRK